jgi:heme/copper-type cytochrome/quinol oxidase subunit 3
MSTAHAVVDQHHGGHDDHHGHVEHSFTGIPSKKILMWAFLASDCMFFGTLISTYIIYHGKSLIGPYPLEILSIPVTTVSSFVLLASSLLMALSVAAVNRNDLAKFRLWIFMTCLFGLIFLGFQSFEFTEFYHKGLTMSTNLFGSTFYTMTGTHGLHVALGVLWLVSWFIYSFFGDMSDKAIDIEVAGLYWHFVDIVWIVIFTVIYLIEFVGAGA